MEPATLYPPAMAGIPGHTGLLHSLREPLSPMKNTGNTAAGMVTGHLATTGTQLDDVDTYAASMYASGELSSPKAFAFSKAHVRIDWRALSGIDIDHVVRCCLSRQLIILSNAFVTHAYLGPQRDATLHGTSWTHCSTQHQGSTTTSITVDAACMV